MARRQLGFGLVAGVVVLAVLVAVVVIPGGGPGSGPLTRDEYHDRMGEVIAAAHLELMPTDRAGLAESSRGVGDVVDELGEITPPPEVAGLHARFVSGLQDYGRMLERLSDLERGGGAVEFNERLAELGGLYRFDWVQALNELVAQGYVPADTQ